MEELAAFIGLSWATLFWHSLICLQYVPWHISKPVPSHAELRSVHDSSDSL